MGGSEMVGHSQQAVMHLVTVRAGSGSPHLRPVAPAREVGGKVGSGKVGSPRITPSQRDGAAGRRDLGVTAPSHVDAGVAGESDFFWRRLSATAKTTPQRC